MVDGLKIAFETIKKNITNMIMLGTFAKATGMVGIEDLQAAMGDRPRVPRWPRRTRPP